MMEDKYIKFYKTFDKRFKSNNNLILCSKTLSDGGIILGSEVNDESVFQEGKSKESIGHSRSVFLLLQFQPGTKLLNLLTNYTTQNISTTVE